MPGSLSRIARGVADADFTGEGMSPQTAMGMAYLAGGGSIALVMSNAASAQQRGQVIGAAALSKVVARILAT